MAIGPANPVFTQFRMNSFTPGYADESAKSETAEPADANRPTHKLRTALGRPSIPPVLAKLPPTSTTRPASEASSTPAGGLSKQAGRASPGLPADGTGALSQGRPRPPAGSDSRSVQAPRPAASAFTPPQASLPSRPGAMSQGRPTAPDFGSIGPQPRPGLPEPPRFDAGRQSGALSEGAPRYERLPEKVDEEEAMREVRQAERRAVEAALESNMVRRAMEAKAVQEESFAIAARQQGAPPAAGSDVLLTDQHVEPPFDPDVRRELRRTPPEARESVVRHRSVLFDHVGGRNRVNESSDRGDEAITRQRERGRRQFELRQRRNAEVTAKRELGAEQRRIEEYQRLEASQMAQLASRVEARRQVILNNSASRQVARDVASESIDASIRTRRARARELVVSARQQNLEAHNSTSAARSTAVAARQRDVFDLQVQIANTKREARENPPPSTGDESQQALARSRTGIQRFQQVRADKSVVLGRVEAQRVDTRAQKDGASRDIDAGRLERATERSQNIRRRLTATYGGEGAKSTGQRIGRPV